MLGTPARILHHVYDRTRRYGLRSGWVCLRSHVVNFIGRWLNRLIPSKRRACPCCGWEGLLFRTLDIGQMSYPEVECPGCLCHDRHRLLLLTLERHPPAFMANNGTILHFAPENQLVDLIREKPNLNCVSTDLAFGQLSHGLRPYFVADGHHMPICDNAFEGLFIIHVLEHVTNDRAVLAECRRILKPGGTAVVMIPIDPKRSTSEDWGAPDPEVYDHVRDYAEQDFPEKLTAFTLRKFAPADVLSPEEQRRFSVRDSEIVWYCTRP